MKDQSYFSRSMAILLMLVGLYGQADDKIDFNRDIRPIFSDRCFGCHGPDEKARQADLRFDIAQDVEGPFRDRGGYQALMPHDLSGSAVWYRLTTSDTEAVMPPADSHEQPLSTVERDLIKQWILQGAVYQDFWSFVPPQRPTIPEVTNKTWSSSGIDHLVMARLEKEGLKPQECADKRTLIRRVTLDLTGLPPTRQAIHDFLADTSDNAYERLVDRLLANPQYGEHMAKYWLDLVRFADTNGMHHDHYREMTPYRDWVIRAFNNNLPFDQFLTFQLAGDLYDEPTLDQQIASGFHRLHLVIDSGTALPEESFHRNVVDRVNAFGTVVLGLTVQCATCHDHKYDPLTQKDFYRLYAFFNNIDAQPETPGHRIHAPYLQLPTEEQREQMAQLNAKITDTDTKVQQLKEKLQQLNKIIDQDLGVPRDEVKTQTEALKEVEKILEKLIEQRNTFKKEIPVTLVMKERSEVRSTHVRVRGAYDQLGEQVQRNTPSFLPPLLANKEVKTRMDLAKWVTDARNPLVARVAVNRFWQQLFGVGLVKTSEDFGGQGEWPSHPDVLDNLAVEMMRCQGDIKWLIRSIMISATYRQSSSTDPASFVADPENRLLARGPRFRLDSEMIRDQILAVSGLLVSKMYGRSVKPPQPPNLWKSVSMVSSNTYSFTADTGDEIYRRSLYSFWKRAMPPPQMTIFDAPTRESCIARRERTNTPLQALVLMNEKQYFQSARHFALQLLAVPEMTEKERLDWAYESITAQLPDDVELAALQEGLDTFQAVYDNDLPSAKALTVDLTAPSDKQRIEIAAYTLLINSLFNLDITKSRE